MDINRHQLEICDKYGAPYVEAKLNLRIGLADNVESSQWPINGLRHPVTEDTTGWYIWAGELYSTAPDFFKPVHLYHLMDICPLIMKYMSLAPGWRFLVTDTYEDVWKDDTLLIFYK